MGSLESFTKIMKGTGKQLSKEASAAAILGVGAVNSVYEGGKVLGKAGSHLFEPVAKGDEQMLLQHALPFRMKKSGAFGIAGVIGAGAIGLEGLKTKNRSDLGELSSGEMANTVGISRTPNLNATIDQVESNDEARKDFYHHGLGAGTYGAEGDLVFALHNLRNG